MRDVAEVARRFGIDQWHPMWDPNCDITGSVIGIPDRKIDMRDVAVVAKNFGKIDPQPSPLNIPQILDSK